MKTTTFSSIRLALSLALLSFGGLNARAAIKILQAVGPADHIPASVCPATDGANVLAPDPVVYLPPPGLFTPIRLELLLGDTPWPGWTFKKGKALKGTLTVNTYKSVFDGDHYSGADIEAEYTPAATDPAGLHFTQLVTTSDPAAGATSPYIDPFPNDDNLPFYWTQAEETAMGTSLKFSDGSRRSHPPTSFVTWRGDLYITSWDGKTPGVVTIHDGIRWGFDAGCINWFGIIITVTVTEPTTCTLTWPETTWPCRVETSTTLGTSARWEPLNGVVTTTTNGQNRMIIARTHEQQYFRLAITAPPLQPPTIESQPEHRTDAFGSTVEFEVDATGTAELTYQWHHDGMPIPGATDSILTIMNARPADQGQYTVTIENQAGSITSAPAMLVLRNCALTILGQPESTMNAVGSLATFTVEANGFPALLEYQWQTRRPSSLAFVNIPGATSASYSTPTTMNDNGSQYRCVIDNGCASVTSTKATLTVKSEQDTTPPMVQTVFTECPAPMLVVMFSEPVHPESAMQPNNYQLRSGILNNLRVLEAQVLGPNMVQLFLSGPVPPEGTLLTVRNVRDLAGNVIPDGNMTPVNCDGTPASRQ